MKLVVVLPNGRKLQVEGKEGASVMSAMRDGGVPIRAECGGALACATCHIHISSDYQAAVGAAGEEEAELLDDSDYTVPESRLSCQIDCAVHLDGLEVALQLDALEDH